MKRAARVGQSQAREHVAKAADTAISFAPHLYTVESVHTVSG
jgi:hypothetical protein